MTCAPDLRTGEARPEGTFGALPTKDDVRAAEDLYQRVKAIPLEERERQRFIAEATRAFALHVRAAELRREREQGCLVGTACRTPRSSGTARRWTRH